MEKQELPPLVAPPRPRQRPDQRTLTTLFLMTLAGLYALSHWGLNTDHIRSRLSPSGATESVPLFNWAISPSSRSLEYADCYPELGDGFQCAKLELPMDYWNGSTAATISLAVLRRPARVPVTDERYGGPVLLNPGGPSGSGVDFALGAGRLIQSFIDSPEGKYYDIIGFDPRGVGFSTPIAFCIADYNMAQSWHLRVLEEGVLGSSDASFGRLWSMAIARGGSCSLPLPDGEPNIKQYMTTASVVRDMLSLIEAHGEWREKEVRRLLGKGQRCHATVDVPESLKHKPGQEKLLYWGFSYGSYLGMSFAAMFPDRVHRLIVDGVVDAVDYTKALWYDNLVDTEKDVDLFYYHCARVGWPTCALGNQTGESTPGGVRQRVDNITQNLWHNTLPVIGDYPEVIEFSDVKNLMFGALYGPIGSFPTVAELLLDIEQGNGTRFAQTLKLAHRFDCSSIRTGSGMPTLDPSLATAGPMDATVAIACTDGDEQSFMNRDHFAKFLKKIVELSPSIGAIWATIRLHCIHYSVRAFHRFQGPFEANTSHPILFLGNTADPVTPLRNAMNMAKNYKGAVALTQDSPGHCTIAAPSSCTVRHVRRYFQTGEMPPMNTTCKADYEPFGPTPGKDEELSLSSKQFVEDMSRLHTVLKTVGGGLMGHSLPQMNDRAVF